MATIIKNMCTMVCTWTVLQWTRCPSSASIEQLVSLVHMNSARISFVSKIINGRDFRKIYYSLSDIKIQAEVVHCMHLIKFETFTFADYHFKVQKRQLALDVATLVPPT